MSKIEDALFERRYFCPECGNLMQWESEWEDSLVCPVCGASADPEFYGMTEDEIDAMYPTREQVLGIAGEDDEEDEDNEFGETYDEVCGELSDND